MPFSGGCGPKGKKKFGGVGLAVTRRRFFFAPETPKSAVRYAKKRIPEGKRAIRDFQNEANPSFGGSLPNLFPGAQNRYHPIREVATHKEPGKDKGRAQHRNTVARRKNRCPQATRAAKPCVPRHAQASARRFLREVTMMFDATHRFVMAGHSVSIDFTKQGWRQFAAVNRRLAARYIRAFILKRELQQYIAAHEAAGVHLDTQCQEVCYDSGIYLLLRRTQGTWYISSDVSNLLPRSQLAAGDIVMTYVGANIGDVALIDDKHRYHLAPNVAKISPDKEKYDSVFFMHMLMMLRTYISGNSADTAKAALSMERIRNLSVFIPPMNLQRIFASFAEQVEKLKSIVIQNFEQLEMIKKSLLQQYFG